MPELSPQNPFKDVFLAPDANEDITPHQETITMCEQASESLLGSKEAMATLAARVEGESERSTVYAPLYNHLPMETLSDLAVIGGCLTYASQSTSIVARDPSQETAAGAITQFKVRPDKRGLILALPEILDRLKDADIGEIGTLEGASEIPTQPKVEDFNGPVETMGAIEELVTKIDSMVGDARKVAARIPSEAEMKILTGMRVVALARFLEHADVQKLMKSIKVRDVSEYDDNYVAQALCLLSDNLSHYYETEHSPKRLAQLIQGISYEAELIARAKHHDSFFKGRQAKQKEAQNQILSIMRGAVLTPMSFALAKAQFKDFNTDFQLMIAPIQASVVGIELSHLVALKERFNQIVQDTPEPTPEQMVYLLEIEDFIHTYSRRLGQAERQATQPLREERREEYGARIRDLRQRIKHVGAMTLHEEIKQAAKRDRSINGHPRKPAFELEQMAELQHAALDYFMGNKQLRAREGPGLPFTNSLRRGIKGADGRIQITGLDDREIAKSVSSFLHRLGERFIQDQPKLVREAMDGTYQEISALLESIQQLPNQHRETLQLMRNFVTAYEWLAANAELASRNPNVPSEIRNILKHYLLANAVQELPAIEPEPVSEAEPAARDTARGRTQ